MIQNMTFVAKTTTVHNTSKVQKLSLKKNGSDGFFSILLFQHKSITTQILREYILWF